MRSCVAVGCFNKPGKFSNLSFHEFPADIDKRLEWVRNVRKKDWNPEERDVLCSKHFNNECFFYGDGGRKYLRRNAVPTNFSKRTMYFSHPESSENPADTANELEMGPRPSLCGSENWCVHLDHNYSANISLELANEKLKIERHHNDKLKKRTEKLQRQLKTSEKVLSGVMKMIDFSRRSSKPEIALDPLASSNKLPMEILRRLKNKSKYPDSVSSYSEPLKDFAMKLHQCSPRAYRLVRESFQLLLPSESIIKKWKSSVDASLNASSPERRLRKVPKKKRDLSGKLGKGISKKSKQVALEQQSSHQLQVNCENQDVIEIYQTTSFDMEEFIIFDNPK